MAWEWDIKEIYQISYKYYIFTSYSYNAQGQSTGSSQIDNGYSNYYSHAGAYQVTITVALHQRTSQGSTGAGDDGLVNKFFNPTSQQKNTSKKNLLKWVGANDSIKNWH